ncbi:MAG: hypothetical protein WCH99_09095 [Verrucomicrobiota bacterium]
MSKNSHARHARRTETGATTGKAVPATPSSGGAKVRPAKIDVLLFINAVMSSEIIMNPSPAANGNRGLHFGIEVNNGGQRPTLQPRGRVARTLGACHFREFPAFSTVSPSVVSVAP